MVILTAANIDVGKKEYGKWYKGFPFKSVIQATVRKAESLGYNPVVYDLGSLGIGERYVIEDKTFEEKGYYGREVLGGYRSRSLFKPEIVKSCLTKYNDLVVYLDGDAELRASIDETNTNDYDVGVTLRDPCEFESRWYREHFEIAKYLNAGVIFFRPSAAAKDLIERWQRMTEELGNDQMALNKLTCPDEYPAANSVLTINGVRVKYFPCKVYNFYYFDEGLERNIKIMHFKGLVRRFYPFDWRKQCYCLTVIPVLKRLRLLRRALMVGR